MNRYKFIDEGKQHIHTLDNKPLIGTSTVCGILNKNLQYWASGCAVKEFGWTPKKDKETKKAVSQAVRLEAASNRFGEVKGLSNSDYLALLDKAYGAHAETRDKAADKGTDMHALLSAYIQDQIDGKKSPIPPEIEPFARWSKNNVSNFLFTEKHCYSETLWVGGIADFAYTDKFDKVVLGDFKSSAEPYYSHWLQCGGYDIQLRENGLFDANGNLKIEGRVFEQSTISYHAIFCARHGLDKPFYNHQIARMCKAFSYAANLYREKIWFEDGNYVTGGN